jgi:hypothetical protein
MKVTIDLTETQEREFRACADSAGISIERWIEECAAVKATAVIDALQATTRSIRVSSRMANSAINTRTASRRAPRKAPSETMVAARAYNAKFR